MTTIMFPLASVVFAGALCLVTPALAQPSVEGVLIAMPPTQSPFADRGGDRGDLSGYGLSAPLRLSLEASVFPDAHLFPNCASREDDIGNSLGGISTQHYWEWRFAPRLVLSGFTQIGCPVDAGIGSVLTYSVPLRDSMQLVLGAGLYAAPGQIPFFGSLQPAFLQGLRSVSSAANEAGRVGMVWTAKNGYLYNLGVEVLGTERRTITFGGTFSR